MANTKAMVANRDCEGGFEMATAGPYEKYFYRPEAQTMTRAELREVQNAKLRREIDRVWNQPIPFFKRKMESVGLRPEHIKTVDDLKNFPPTIKDELRVNEEEHPPF